MLKDVSPGLQEDPLLPKRGFTHNRSNLIIQSLSGEGHGTRPNGVRVVRFLGVGGSGFIRANAPHGCPGLTTPRRGVF